MKIPMQMLTTLLAFVLITGCESDPAKVSKDDLAKVQKSTEALAVGMERDAALDSIKKGNKVRLSSTMVGEDSVEEWRVEAYHDDDWNKSRQMKVTFLYFMNGKLVDISDQRLDYRNNSQLVADWQGRSSS